MSSYLGAAKGIVQAVIVSLVAVVASLGGCAKPQYDIVINDAIVVDGSGAPRRTADIAIVADKIVAIEAEIDIGAARQVIDAQGLVAAPGFIEPHAHITNIEEQPLAANYLHQGVTTIANTLHSVDQPYPMAEFLDRIEVAPNTVWTAGHTWIRKRVMGLDNRAPSEAEFEAMRELAAEAMDAGAIGLGTGLEYVPASFAEREEVVELARSIRTDNALYVTHLRDEGARLIAALEESLDIGNAADLPVHISHIKNTGVDNWRQTDEALAVIDAAAAAGQQVSFDVYPYTAFSTYSDVLFPARVLAGGVEAFRERIRDPANRQRLAEEMLTIYTSQTAGELSSVQFRDVPGFEGKTLADYVESIGSEPTMEAGIEAIIDLQAAGGFIAIFHAMAEEDVERFMLHPLASISGDGSLVKPGQGFPHPRSYGAFPRVLGRYVRERGLMSLEQAVRKMTSVTADHLRIEGRGLLANGAFADIVLFDADAVGDCATFTAPHCYSTGVEHLLVNGVPVLSNGEVTLAKPGRPLRRQGMQE